MKPKKKARICGGAGLTAWRITAKRNSVPTGKRTMVSKSDESKMFLKSLIPSGALL
jgi:hypothetical protein